MAIELSGILGPAVTTFQRDGEALDLAAFRANIGAHIEAGLSGVVVTGSTGEAALLDEGERAALVAAAREVVPRERLLIAGTGAESTRTAVRLARQAAEQGADAVLVVAPHYYGPAMTAPALLGHYSRLADESPVPVMLYNIPKYMHFSLAPSLVEQLARHENVIGIKDSSGNLELLAAYMGAQSDRFSVLTGNAGTMLAALRMGARGGILAAGLFAPAVTLDVYEAGRRGDAARDEAEQAQARLGPLGQRIVGEMGIAGVKAALDLVGLRGGPVRSPLQPLPASDVAAVAELLRAAELSPVA